MTDRSSGKKRGFAFVTFDDHDAVDRIVSKCWKCRCQCLYANVPCKNSSNQCICQPPFSLLQSRSTIHWMAITVKCGKLFQRKTWTDQGWAWEVWITSALSTLYFGYTLAKKSDVCISSSFRAKGWKFWQRGWIWRYAQFIRDTPIYIGWYLACWLLANKLLKLNWLMATRRWQQMTCTRVVWHVCQSNLPPWAQNPRSSMVVTSLSLSVTWITSDEFASLFQSSYILLLSYY